jgi:hypothetical protein
MLIFEGLCAVQSDMLMQLQKGDLTDFLVKLVKPNFSISAPTFFLDSPAVIANAAAGVSFGFTGVNYAPCAIPVIPAGVGIFPQGINIQPEVFNIAPTGEPPSMAPLQSSLSQCWMCLCASVGVPRSQATLDTTASLHTSAILAAYGHIVHDESPVMTLPAF